MATSLNQLKKEMLVAKLKYFTKVKEEVLPLVIEELKTKVLNPYHFYYDKINNPNNKESTDATKMTKDEEQMYVKLRLKVHPDKNIGNEENATKAFQKIDEYIEKKEFTIIQFLYSQIDRTDFIELVNNISLEELMNDEKYLEKKIMEIEESIWYQYYIGHSYWKTLYITKDELIELQVKDFKQKLWHLLRPYIKY